MKAIGADGINGDTFSGIPVEFRNAADAVGHPLALEPECQMQDQAMIAWNIMTWGYWDYPPMPVVSKYKWLESRHMVNVCERWAMDRTDGLQSAFFNGVGYESWENVWGVCNQFTPRDAEALRRIATIERAMADMLVSPDWEPHVPTLQQGVFASRFPLKDRTLWLMVNRSNKDLQRRTTCRAVFRGRSLLRSVERRPAETGDRRRKPPGSLSRSRPAATARFSPLPTEQTPADVKELMGTMARLAAVPLGRYSSQWKMLPQKIVKIAPTKPLADDNRRHGAHSGREISLQGLGRRDRRGRRPRR